MKDVRRFPTSFGHQWLADMARIDALPGGGVRIGMARMSDWAAEWRCAGDSLSLPSSAFSPHPANCATWRRSRNIMQRTRCAYFRRIGAAPQRTRPGVRRLRGLNEITHFGWSESCDGDNPSIGVALAAMDAS